MLRWWFLAALALLATGCSTKSSAPVTCDNGGSWLLAFASDRRQPAGHYQIWLYDVDAQGFRLLRNLASSSGIDSTPSISSDGQLIAFTRTDSIHPSLSRVLVYDRASCGFAPAGAGIDTGHEKDPAFTGNALRLAFARDTLGYWRIRMILATGALVPLGHLGDPQPYDDWAPSPNSTGSLIAFVSNRITVQYPDGSPHVFVYDVAHDSLLATPGLDTVGTYLDPAITSDGHWLFFASNRTGGLGGFDLWRYDLTTRTLQALPAANSDQDDRHPAVRPDGGLIAFQSGRTGGGGKNDLWIYALGGGAPYQGVGMASPGDDLHPAMAWP